MLPFDKVTCNMLLTPYLYMCVCVCPQYNVLFPHVKDLFEPQTGLLRYVLEQPYSREMVCNMLGLNKQVGRPVSAPLPPAVITCPVQPPPYCRIFPIPLVFFRCFCNLLFYLITSSLTWICFLPRIFFNLYLPPSSSPSLFPDNSCVKPCVKQANAVSLTHDALVLVCAVGFMQFQLSPAHWTELSQAGCR